MKDNIKEIHIEPTSLCNAECPMCARNINGNGINPHISLKSLDLNWFKNNLIPEKIKQLDKIFFCGNVGDPAGTPELLEIIQYIKTSNPNLVVGLNTNGGLKTATWWSKLGHLLDGRFDYCVFSIDGLQDTNHLYRQNVVWENVERNMRAFIDAGGRARWDYIIFGHNEHQVEEAEALAEAWGVERFQKKKSARFFTAGSERRRVSCLLRRLRASILRLNSSKVSWSGLTITRPLSPSTMIVSPSDILDKIFVTPSTAGIFNDLAIMAVCPSEPPCSVISPAILAGSIKAVSAGLNS